MLQRITQVGKRIRGIDTGLLLEGGARFFISLVLAMASAFGSFSPFGVAFAAIAPVGTGGLVSALGAALGYLISRGLLGSLKYAAAIVLIRWTYYILRSSDKSEARLFRPAVTLIAMSALGFIYAFDSGWKPVPLALFITESFTAAALVFFYDVALSPWNEVSEGSFGRLSHTVSTVLLAASFAMGLANIRLFGALSLGGALATALVMVAAYKGGIGAGAAIGAAFGAAMDLSSGTVGLFTAYYSISALVAGIFSKSGRLIYILSYIAINAVTVLWSFNLTGSIGPLYDCFAASVIMMLLPDTLLSKVGSLFPLKASGYGFIRAREYARRRLVLAGEGFGTLVDTAKSVAQSGENLEDPAKIFDAAADTVCRSCPHSARCWQREYQETRDMLTGLTPKLMGEGGIAADDLPERFTEGCERVDRLVSEINSEARSRRLRRQFTRRLGMSRDAGLSQYGDLAAVLASLSRDLGRDVTVEPALEKRIMKWLSAKGIDASAAVLRIRGGRLRIELRGEALRELTKDEDWINGVSQIAGRPLRLSEEAAGEGRLILIERPPFSLTLGAAKSGKGGGISGDKCTSFLTDEGIFSLILADGMGTGTEAAKISAAVISALRRFMMAGIEPELSLSLLDNMMFLKNEGDTESSTVDLFTVDSFTGEARFYKYGAAPSYIRRDGRVKTVSSRLLPAGLSEAGGARDKGRRMKLKDCDMAVIVSDGIAAGADDRWLRELIAAYGGIEPRGLARSIMEKAIEKNAASDDMTVLVVSVKES